jgi:uncharacterized protein (TIGR02001 family)
MLSQKRIKVKIINLILVSFIFLFSTPQAFSKVKISSSVSLVSRYIWRGFDTIPNNKPALQPSLTLNSGKNNLWCNLWSAIALADTNFVELDFIVGYEKALSNDATLCTGAGYFTFPSCLNYPDKNSTSPEIYLGASFGFIPLCPRLTAYYDFNLGDGLYATLDLQKSFTLGGEVLCSTFLLGYTTQYKKIGVDPGISDICFGLSTDFVFRRLTLTPSFNYVVVPSETINKEDEIWGGLSINYDF